MDENIYCRLYISALVAKNGVGSQMMQDLHLSRKEADQSQSRRDFLREKRILVKLERKTIVQLKR